MALINLKDYVKLKLDYFDKKINNLKNIVDSSSVNIDSIIKDLNSNHKGYAYYENARYENSEITTGVNVPLNDNVSIVKHYDRDCFTVCIKNILSKLRLGHNNFVVAIFNDDNAVIREYLPDGGSWDGKNMGYEEKWWRYNKNIKLYDMCFNYIHHDEEQLWYTGQTNYNNMFYCDGYDSISFIFYVEGAETREEFDQLIDDYIKSIKLYKILETGNQVTNKTNEHTIKYIKETYGYDYRLVLDIEQWAFREDPASDYRNYFELGNAGNNLLIDWGDGTLSKIDNAKGKISSSAHHYKDHGIYRIKVYCSNETFDFNKISCYSIHYIDVSGCTTNCHIETVNFYPEELNITNKFTNKDGNAFFQIQSGFNFEGCDFSNMVDGNNLFMCGIDRIPSSIDFSKIKDAHYMFQQAVRLKDATGVDTTTMIDVSGLFYCCNSLEIVPQLNLQNSTGMGCMFAECPNLEYVDLINTGKCESADWMFASCPKLKEVKTLDLSSCSVNYVDYMFDYCWSLEKVIIIGTQAAAVMDTIISQLPTNNLGKQRIFDISGCTNKDGVTATAEGWTIVK